MDLLDTVRKTIAEQRLISPGDKVVVGVSGGPDSLALLHLLCALRGELRLDLHVAHLNHRLRASESEADAEMVARLAREWGLPATIESLDVSAWAREQRLGLEEAARIARYRFLSAVARRLDARLIAVAHHADDQVESVVMHFLRGAGLGGLRGMPYAIPEFVFLPPRRGEEPSAAAADEEPRRLIVRPLLDVTRAQIEAYCAAHALTPRRDRSNEDTTLFRNRLRHEVIPYLETQNPGLRRVLLHTSRALADDYEIVQGEVRKATARVVREEGGLLIFALSPWRALAAALRRGTLRAAVEQLRRDLRDVDWAPVEEAHRIACTQGTGAAASLPGGLLLRVGYDELVMGAAARVRAWAPPFDAPLLESEVVPLPLQGVVALPNSEWTVETAWGRPDTADRWTAALDFERCGEGCVLRRRRPGDRFQPAGLNGHSRPLHRFLIDLKVPRAARDRLPLLAAGENILWVCGLRVDERARVTPATGRVWTVRFRKKGQ